MLNRYVFWLVAALAIGCTFTTEKSNTMFDSGEDVGQSPLKKAVGWSAIGNLISGGSDLQVGLQQDLGEAGAYTCNFSLSPIDDISPATTATLRAQALVEWTVAGNTIRRLISVTNGASISGVAQTVRVTITDVSTAEGGAVDLGKTYQVAVQVAPGTRANTEQPPILQQQNIVFIVLNGGNTNVPIPQGVGAKNVLVTVASIDLSPIPEQNVRVTQTTAAATSISAYDPRAFGWVPLAPGATTINLANVSGKTALFAVYFGIDG